MDLNEFLNQPIEYPEYMRKQAAAAIAILTEWQDPTSLARYASEEEFLETFLKRHEVTHEDLIWGFLQIGMVSVGFNAMFMQKSISEVLQALAITNQQL
jgi:hypothetical protein